MPKLLSGDQVARYHRDGFLSPVTVMSAAEAGAIRQAYEAAESRWPAALAGANRNNAHLSFRFLDEVVHHTSILDAVEDLIGPDILVIGSVFFVKEPRDPGFVSWHQDVTYMGLEPHLGVTAWLALTPSNQESGCMRMIPGSHKADLRAHRDTYGEANILTRGQSIAEIDEAAAVDILLEPGQISLHHLKVIHGSKPNRSRDRRIGFAIQSYLPPQVRQTKGVSFVQLARGHDSQGNFQAAPRPRTDMDPADVARRDHVNKLWSEILYQGAARKRDY